LAAAGKGGGGGGGEEGGEGGEKGLLPVLTAAYEEGTCAYPCYASSGEPRYVPAEPSLPPSLPPSLRSLFVCLSLLQYASSGEPRYVFQI
jgi:hypothetical protein